jgi:hypothetical protein
MTAPNIGKQQIHTVLRNQLDDVGSSAFIPCLHECCIARRDE